MKRALLSMLVLAGCSRDLTTPPLPQPGRVTGRVVYATPGRSALKPAANAVISVLGSGLTTTTNLAGTFTLAPLEATTGLLHFTFDSDGDGVIDLQKVEQLSDWKTGPTRQVLMGDVVLAENASVRGKVFVADRPGARSGLGGTTIFVPGGPFAATTADDGSFALPNLPEGPLQFTVFRTGYAAKALGAVTLRAGEDYLFKDVILSLSLDAPGPGSIVGSLAFAPEVFGTGDTAITAQPLTGSSVPGAVSDDRSFRFDALPQGLYTLTATRSGYTRARIFNVLVLPLKESTLGAVLLTDAPEADAGRFPATGIGLDGGACVGAGCTPCLSNLQCSNTQWCDNFYCAPQCSGVVGCSNGRACDSATKTCVTPCSAGCPSGQQCEAGICRAECDGSFMCSVGFKCNSQRSCVPECVTEPDCGQQHVTCVAGQCVPKGTCSNDLDCASDRMCLGTNCVPRLTARSDGGQSPFVCTIACNCRLGEWCTNGLCLPDVLPTLYFATDGDGGGSMQAPSSALGAKLSTAAVNDVFALRRGDRFFEANGFTVQKNRVTVAGGYEVCNGQRWVRSDLGRTTLAADGGTVIQALGLPTVPVDDVRLRNLSLETSAGAAGCGDHSLYGSNTRRFEVSHVDGALVVGSDCSGTGTNALIQCDDCEQALISEVSFKSSMSRNNTTAAVFLNRSSGVIRRLTSEKQSAVHRLFRFVLLEGATGPTQVQDCVLPEVSSSGGTSALFASACYANPVVAERNVLSWNRATQTTGDVGLVTGLNCHDMQVRDNQIDGAAFTGSVNPYSSAILLDGSAGTLVRNRIKLPTTPSASVLSAILVQNAFSVTTVSGNSITGGSSATSVHGIRLVGNTVPVVVAGNVIDIGPSKTVVGIGSKIGASVRLSDNFSRATGNKTCQSTAYGAEIEETHSVIERNRLFATGAALNRGLQIATLKNYELYSNHLSAGSAECAGDATALVVLDVTSTFMSGNTLEVDADPTTTGSSNGIFCDDSTVVAEANVIGSGRAPLRQVLSYLGTRCQAPGNFSRNYFWHDAVTSGFAPNDGVLIVTGADAGTFDGGNVLADNLSPFDAVQPTLADGGALPRHRLSAGSLARDRGPLPKQKDGTDLWLDLERRPRDAGASADLGCCERY